MKQQSKSVGLLVVLSLLALAGCSQSVAIEQKSAVNKAESAQRFRLTDEPENIMPFDEARKLAEDQADTTLALIGRVADSGDALLIRDPAAGIVDESAESEGHGHEDCEDCVFCLHREAQSTAVTRFETASGDPIAFSTADLGLTDGELIVVQGKGRVNSDKQFEITVEGVYQRE